MQYLIPPTQVHTALWTLTIQYPIPPTAARPAPDWCVARGQTAGVAALPCFWDA
jgi:hypothetical protein